MPEAADGLDGLFGALANGHRREMVRLLGLQPHSISRLADIRGLSLPAINKQSNYSFAGSDQLAFQIEQGAAAFSCWFGVEAPRAAMWAAIPRARTVHAL